MHSWRISQIKLRRSNAIYAVPLEHLRGFLGWLVIFYRLCYQSIFHCALDHTANIFFQYSLHIFPFLHSFWENCLTLGSYWQRKDQSYVPVMPPISETEMKSYKAKSNLFYFIVYIMIFQLGSWQAHRVNLSWERFGASVPYLIYVYLYLPNGPEGSDPSWNTTLCLPWQKDYFHFPLVASRVYWWGSPDLKLFCYLLQTTVNLSTVFFQNSMKPFQLPFIGTESTNLGVLQRLVTLPFLQILQFSLCAP